MVRPTTPPTEALGVGAWPHSPAASISDGGAPGRVCSCAGSGWAGKELGIEQLGSSLSRVHGGFCSLGNHTAVPP